MENLPPTSGLRRVDLRICLLLALLCIGIYNANWRVITASDTYSTRFLPFAILGYHTLYMDEIASAASEGRTHPYWIITNPRGHLVSRYSIVTPLLVTPLYIPAAIYLHARGWTEHRMDRLARLMEKISASLIASLSVTILYLALRRRAEVRTALLLSIAFAFGTNIWALSSQGLWQHGLAGLLLASMLLLITGPCTKARAFAAGFLCALIPFNRSADGLFAIALGVYSIMWARRSMWLVMAGGIVSSAPLLAYNIGVMGSILGGDGSTINADFYRFSMPAGAAGLLFSPARGLFFFTPFLIALPFGLWRIFRRPAPDPSGVTEAGPGDRPLFILICISFVLQVLVYSKADWRDGAAWGPRYLTDVLPFFIWMMVPVVDAMGRLGLAVFKLAVGISIAIQAVGAFWYTGKSDELLNILATTPAAMHAVWNLRKTPFIVEFRHPRAMRDLTLNVQGCIDSVTAGGHEITEAPADSVINVSGWTLAGHRTPWRIIAQLVPLGDFGEHYVLQDTLAFNSRPDVANTVHSLSPVGWSISLKLNGLPPGDYVIEVTEQAGDGAEFRPVSRRAFKVIPKQP
ncbi:MAG: hypothetical protein WCD79_02750 [Chthoniobacteraceae bacterium]